MGTEHQRWREQWTHFAPSINDERRQLERWLMPLHLSDVRGLDVLDAGCGSGVHTMLYADAGAKSVHAVDYASWKEAEARFGDLPNVSFGQLDLCTQRPPGTYDLVCCVGVLPHVPDPEAAVRNLAAAVRPGGRLLIWATVREGNTGLLMFDATKVLITSWATKGIKLAMARLLALATLPGQTLAARSAVVRRALPYGDYLARLSALPFARVTQNFYDALNAPRRILFTTDQVTGWLRSAGLSVQVHVTDDNKSRTWLAHLAN